MDEAERIGQLEKEVLRIQIEADRIRVHEASMSPEINDSVNRPRTSGRSPIYLCFAMLRMIWTHIFRDAKHMQRTRDGKLTVLELI